MVGCSTCGSANPDGFRFCGACASPLAAPVPVHEERKTVTVLFADLAGFTARSDGADPEDVLALVRPFHTILRRETEAFGGTLARIVGDAGMLVFGYPQAHEDDPERAVRAAFAVLDALRRLNAERPGLDLHARIGINTAEAVVTYGSRLEDADDIMGDGVNVAARLQAAAPVDGIVVGEATHRAAAGAFRWESLPPIVAKGKSEPIPVWRPLGPLARSHGPLRPETTPFVGRAMELSTLVQVFERSRTTPSLEIVTVVANPGIGKSRLVRELARYVDSLPNLVTWRVGRCLPYGDGISFWALGEIVKAQVGILDTDDQVTLSAKLDAALTEPDLSLRSWMKDRLGPLVGLETGTDPPQQEEAFTAWRRFLEAIGRAGPTILIVEDLHWADDSLVTFLGRFAAKAAGLPILLIATARPEIEERHPSWPGRARRSTVLSLEALGDRDMTALVEATIPGVSADLLAMVLERAAGSPLYAEQLAAMFRDRHPSIGHGTLEGDPVPTTIQALLASRIDILPPHVKAVILDASVIGKVFWSGAAAALGHRRLTDVEPILADLARRELIRPVVPSSMAGEAEYTFVHALVRDCAYGELPRGARLARHKAAAAWITERAGRALGEDAEIVVAHLEQAIVLATATGATDEIDLIQVNLVDALLVAADNAMRRDVPRAAAHLVRVLSIVDADDPRRPAIQARLGWAHVTMSQFGEAVRHFEEARELLLRRGKDLLAAEIAAPMAVALTNAGMVDRAMEVLRQARAVLAADPGGPLLAVMAEQAYAAMRAGQWTLSTTLGHETVALAEALGLPPPPRALMARSSEGDIERAIEIAEAAGDLRTALNGLTNLGINQANLREAIVTLDRAIAFAQSHGLPDAAPGRIRLQRGFEAGRADGVMDGLMALEARSRERGDMFNAVATEVALIDLRLTVGEPVESIDHLAGAYHAVGISLSELGLLQARFELAHGRRDQAGRRLAEAMDCNEGGEVVYDMMSLVEACLSAGDLALARRALSQASHPAAFMAPVYDQGRSDAADMAAAGLVAEADGDHGAARAAYEHALGTFTRLGAVLAHALVLVWLGRCRLATGEVAEGVGCLRQARATLASMGVKPRLAEIDNLLASAGAGSRGGPEPA